MFCNKCGTELSEKDQFCYKCGASISQNNELKIEIQPQQEKKKKK